VASICRLEGAATPVIENSSEKSKVGMLFLSMDGMMVYGRIPPRGSCDEQLRIMTDC
jgi:hypothetical protein